MFYNNFISTNAYQLSFYYLYVIDVCMRPRIIAFFFFFLSPIIIDHKSFNGNVVCQCSAGIFFFSYFMLVCSCGFLKKCENWRFNIAQDGLYLFGDLFVMPERMKEALINITIGRVSREPRSRWNFMTSH